MIQLVEETFQIGYFYPFKIPSNNMNRIQKLKEMLCQVCLKPSEIDDIQETKRLLSEDLYHISPLSKAINRDVLSLAYTPGVGQVCMEIKEHPELSDVLTFRARAVAVVSDGSMLDSQGRRFMPVMDWLIAQLKFHAGVDAFPFVIRKQTNMEDFFRDLSTSYGNILYLDNKQIPKIPQNVLLVKQQQVANHFKLELTDASKTAPIIGYCIQNKIKGVATESHYESGKDFNTGNFVEIKPFQMVFHDQKSLKEHAIYFHKFYQGKIVIELNFRDLYRIKPYFSEKALRKLVKEQDPYSKTRKVSAIVTDGTAILGLGNIGPVAGLPVMEGKSLLFKLLGDVDVVPFCMYPRKSADQLIHAINNSAGYFRAINLQDIKAPQCFDVQRGLKKLKNIPIFHDDQHGTAIVVLGGLITAMKLAGKKFEDSKFIINGAGAAGDTIARLILKYGAQGKKMIICDSKGAIYQGRKQGMNGEKQDLAKISNLTEKHGHLQDIIDGADVFIGVSVGNVLKKEWIKKMNQKAIIFALANPDPEILPDDAKQGGAFIYASGRSDFENQINNSLVFPGIFKGILKHTLSEITEDMKINAAVAISKMTKSPSVDYIIPDSLDRDVTLKIAQELGKGLSKK